MGMRAFLIFCHHQCFERFLYSLLAVKAEIFVQNGLAYLSCSCPVKITLSTAEPLFNQCAVFHR